MLVLFTLVALSALLSLLSFFFAEGEYMTILCRCFLNYTFGTSFQNFPPLTLFPP